MGRLHHTPWGDASPAEPASLRAATRAVLERSPEEGRRLIDEGEWITPVFWDAWGTTLVLHGWDQARLRRIIVDYGTELRLWVVGERTWEHCVDGLAGRIQRRLPDGESTRA